MKNNEKGALIIEASISLTAFMFLILFFLSFSYIYRAEQVVSHAAFQTVQTLAIESYARETIGENGTLEAVTKLSDFVAAISGKPSTTTDSYRSLGKVSNLEGLLLDEFASSIADDRESADEKLKTLGVVDGINGIKFDTIKIIDSVITVNVKYSVKLKFNFFGAEKIDLNKAAVCKAFAEIEEDVGDDDTSGSW